MPEFRFKARNNSGNLVEGSRLSTSVDALAEELEKEGLIPLYIKYDKKDATSKKTSILLFNRNPTTADLHFFCRQMYTLTKAGIPITNAISRLAETTRHPTLARTLEQVAENLAAGQRLSQSMQRYNKIFPNFIIKIVSLGEESGHLEESFFEIAKYLELEDSTIKQIKSVFRYPIFVVVSVVAAIVIVNIFVIPNFSNLFSFFKTSLPLPTRILIATSHFLLNYWWLLLLAIIVGLFSFFYFIKTPAGKYWWGKTIIKLPVVGDMVNRILLGRFAKCFAIVLRAGLSLNQGVMLISETINNEYLRQRTLYMGQLVERGEKLSNSAAAAGIFPTLVLQMISVGEETGDVSTMMEEVADYYEREVAYDLKNLTTIIEPILLIFIAFLVLTLALGIFLPMWDMVNFVNRK